MHFCIFVHSKIIDTYNKKNSTKKRGFSMTLFSVHFYITVYAKSQWTKQMIYDK